MSGWGGMNIGTDVPAWNHHSQIGIVVQKKKR